MPFTNKLPSKPIIVSGYRIKQRSESKSHNRREGNEFATTTKMYVVLSLENMHHAESKVWDKNCRTSHNLQPRELAASVLHFQQVCFQTYGARESLFLSAHFLANCVSEQLENPVNGMSSKFFASGDSDSDTDDFSSSSSDSEHQQGGFSSRFTFESSESEEEEKRVIRSTRDKRFDALQSAANNLRNHVKISDWAAAAQDFDVLHRELEKSKAVRILPALFSIVLGLSLSCSFSCVFGIVFGE